MICKEMFRLKKNGEPYSRCFCRNPELIENYDKAIADKTQTWECHHRKEEFYSQRELIERGEYFDVSPEDLIFFTQAEHSKIDSYCKRNSESMKGKLINRKDLSKKVLCVETDIVYPSTWEAYRQTGISHSSISMVCLGERKTAGKFHWRFYENRTDD